MTMRAIPKSDLVTVDRPEGNETRAYLSTMHGEYKPKHQFAVYGLANSQIAEVMGLNVSAATVETSGVVFIASQPTNQYYGIYSKATASTNKYVDMDISIKPKSTRTVRGRVIERTIGKFETD